MGVENIITFDAHDPRVQNAIPLHGFETIQPAYQFIKNILRNAPDMKLDNDHQMILVELHPAQCTGYEARQGSSDGHQPG